MTRAYLAFTDTGLALAKRLAVALPGSVARCGRDGVSLAEWSSAQFVQSDALIFVGAAGIAVRAIAPHCKSKTTDPAVVVVDECGRFAVPILSGHLGGANDLARAIATVCGAVPVITTATDAHGIFAVDEWAKHQNCMVLEPERIKLVSGKLLAGQPVYYRADFPVTGTVPAGLFPADPPEKADFALTLCPTGQALHLVPRIGVLGIGCKRGTSADTLEAAFAAFCTRHSLDVMEIDIDRPEKIVYVVGLGPGEPFYMTQQAANTLESVDAICGYKVYLDLIRDEFPCEEYYATGMTQELDRCRWALEKARTGKRVALVCSGDAGVYGMASPLLELTPDYPDVAVEVVPGLTAALSGGAVLGAPLAHDFCVISLSDRLTPWEVIEKRLACAAMGDFCVALYNPSSKGRPDYLAKAVCILLENGKSADTVCGIVRNIGREGQTARILTLAQLKDTAVDMFTTVYIGNAATKQLGGRMVTPRGYRR